VYSAGRAGLRLPDFHPTRRSFSRALFFEGIAVARAKDEETAVHNDARSASARVARGRGRLFVFPEGTSSLGPRHLPFKSGAAHNRAPIHLATGRPLRIVPLGIHYARAWPSAARWKCGGEPISTELDPALSPLGRLKELKRR